MPSTFLHSCPLRKLIEHAEQLIRQLLSADTNAGQLHADAQQKQVIEQKTQAALATVRQLLIPHPISTAQDD